MCHCGDNNIELVNDLELVDHVNLSRHSNHEAQVFNLDLAAGQLNLDKPDGILINGDLSVDNLDHRSANPDLDHGSHTPDDIHRSVDLNDPSRGTRCSRPEMPPAPWCF